MTEPVSALLVGGAGGIAGTEIVDRVTESQEERIPEEIQKCVSYMEQCTRIIEQWGERERTRTPVFIDLIVEAAAAARENLSSPLRLEWLILNANAICEISLTIGTRTYPFSLINTNPLPVPFPITINGGSDLTLTAVGLGAGQFARAYLFGYYERVSQMLNSDRPNA
jgi:hypothetical protein